MSQPMKDVVSEGLRARIALPDRKTNRGVLVLPAVSGLAGVNRALGDLAAAGFTALAWDPFSAYDAGIDENEKGRIANNVQQDAQVLNDHKHWAGYMQKELGLARISTMGFCMGGRMSILLAAQDPRIVSAVAFYPTMRDPLPALVVDPVPLVSKTKAHIQVHCPGKDALTPHANFHRLQAALEARESGATSIYWHPLAGHGFLSRQDEKGHPDADASAIAWPAAVAFLQSAL